MSITFHQIDIHNKDLYSLLVHHLSNIEKYDYLKNELMISETLIEKNIHTAELSNWLRYLKNDI